MKMQRFAAALLRHVRAWDRPARFALMLALVLLLLSFLALLFGPANIRQPALIGFVGLILAAQVIFMWGNRGMVTPYTLAQRRYLAEDFEGARQLLETAPPDFRTLTLLGNTYRQLGRLDESQGVLTKAVDLRPFDPFPLYGFGRTLLVKGLYAEASEAMNRALAAGAASLVHLDRGEALYRSGAGDEARTLLLANRSLATEPHRLLMTDYILYRLNAGSPPGRALLEAGLPYWRENAHRFRHTPYGQQLTDDIRHLEILLQEM